MTRITAFLLGWNEDSSKGSLILWCAELSGMAVMSIVFLATMEPFGVLVGTTMSTLFTILAYLAKQRWQYHRVVNALTEQEVPQLIPPSNQWTYSTQVWRTFNNKTITPI